MSQLHSLLPSHKPSIDIRHIHCPYRISLTNKAPTNTLAYISTCAHFNVYLSYDNSLRTKSTPLPEPLAW